MARPKKADDKTKEGGSSTISVEDFIRSRDSVVTGLSTLQAAVSDLSRAYISHTNAVLGKGTSVSFDQIAFTNPLAGENGLFSARVPTPAPAVEQPAEGKKRKRAPHDKNAPKRALTPFFLYLQSQRTTIGKELGDKFTAKEIQDEGGRRWREMPDKEKSKWQEEYGINFARYQEHMKAYKAGQPLPDISDVEAKKLYEKNLKDKPAKTGKATGAAADAAAPTADAAADSDESSEEEDAPAKEPTPPPAKKTKTGKDSKRKSTKAEEAAAAAAEKASPEKKKKTGKKDSTPAKAAEEPKSKKKGRKHKSGELDA